MWVNSKVAAEILGVNNKSVEKAALRASKASKKFCSIRSHICNFNYIDGIGRGGKVLQIWIDDSLIEAKKDEICQKNQEFLTYIDGSVKKSSEIQPVDVSVLDSESVKAKNKITESVDSFNYTMEDRNGHNRNNYSGSLHGHNVSLGSIDCDSNSNNSRRHARVYRETKEIGINANYTAINRGELKNGSIGLDHSGNLAAGRKNKNLDGVVNRDLRHYSRSNDNKAILSRKTLDKSEVLAHVKLYGVKAAELEYGIPSKTIYRWQKEFEKSGSKALVDKRGGVSKVDETSIKQAIFAVGTAQMTSWWTVYCLHYCQKNRLKFDQYNLSSDISRATFLRHAATISKNDYEVRTFLRAGLDGFDVRPTISRSWLGINEEWQIDATKFDFMCLDEYGEAKRYTAISMVDVGSGRRVFELFDSANSYANVRLLKKALNAMGRPGYIKGDNGKDYVSKHFQGVLGRLGIVYVKARPFAGYEKGKVERSFGQLQSFFEPLPGFLGHNAGQRMKKEAQALEKSKRLSGVKTNIRNLLTKDEMQAYIDEYAQKIFFAENVEFEPFDFDERVFGVSIRRTLQAEGFSVHASKYLSLDLFRHAKFGEELELIEDIDDVSKFYVYRESEYLCEVVSEEIAQYSAEEVKAVQKEYRKRHIQPLIATIKSLQDNKDASFKEAVADKLKQAQKDKAEVIKKDKNKIVSKVEIEAEVINNSIYLPDIDDALKILEG